LSSQAAADARLCLIVWVRLDRKLLLIAPAIVLVFVAAGIAYTAASRDLLITLSLVALASCAMLAFGIRSVPREHWPRLNLSRSRES
jgi:hypothetical protein